MAQRSNETVVNNAYHLGRTMTYLVFIFLLMFRLTYFLVMNYSQ